MKKTNWGIFNGMKKDLKKLAKIIIYYKQYSLLDNYKILKENKKSFRHLHIAYCELKGRSFSVIENRCKPDNMPDRLLIEKIKVKYLKKMVKHLHFENDPLTLDDKLFEPIPKRKKIPLTIEEKIDKACKDLKKLKEDYLKKVTKGSNEIFYGKQIIENKSDNLYRAKIDNLGKSIVDRVEEYVCPECLGRMQVVNNDVTSGYSTCRRCLGSGKLYAKSN